jgi:hypothetical protein
MIINPAVTLKEIGHPQQASIKKLSPGQGGPPGDSLWDDREDLQPLQDQAQAQQDKGCHDQNECHWLQILYRLGE